MEELQYKLNDTQYLTKLDMKHGYMQMELASRPIITFYTHQGLQLSCRLTFETDTAAEIFHKEIHQILADIHTVMIIYDNILIYGKAKKRTQLDTNQSNTASSGLWTYINL